MGFWSWVGNTVRKVGNVMKKVVRTVTKVVKKVANVVKKVANVAKKVVQKVVQKVVKPIQRVVKKYIMDPVKKAVSWIAKPLKNTWFGRVYGKCRRFLTEHPVGKWIGRGLSIGYNVLVKPYFNPMGALGSVSRLWEAGKKLWKKTVNIGTNLVKQLNVDRYASQVTTMAGEWTGKLAKRGQRFLNHNLRGQSTVDVLTGLVREGENAYRSARNWYDRNDVSGYLRGEYRYISGNFRQATGIGSKLLKQCGNYTRKTSSYVRGVWARNNVSQYLGNEWKYVFGNMRQGIQFGRTFGASLLRKRTWSNIQRTARLVSQPMKKYGWNMFTSGRKGAWNFANETASTWRRHSRGRSWFNIFNGTVERTNTWVRQSSQSGRDWYQQNNIGPRLLEEWRFMSTPQRWWEAQREWREAERQAQEAERRRAQEAEQRRAQEAAERRRVQEAERRRVQEAAQRRRAQEREAAERRLAEQRRAQEAAERRRAECREAERQAQEAERRRRRATGACIVLDKQHYRKDETISIQWDLTGVPERFQFGPDPWIGIIPSHVSSREEVVNDDHDVGYFHPSGLTGCGSLQCGKAGSFQMRAFTADFTGSGVQMGQGASFTVS